MSDSARVSTRSKKTVQYVTDEAGKATAVIIPLAEYEELLEDLEDLATIAERRDEPTIPHRDIVAELEL